MHQASIFSDEMKTTGHNLDLIYIKIKRELEKVITYRNDLPRYLVSLGYCAGFVKLSTYLNPYWESKQ